MVKVETVRKLALALPQAEELPHFEKTSFRVAKKIFATLDKSLMRCVLKLSPIDQSVFCNYNKEIIYPVKGTWGKQGWTIIELKLIKENIFTDALTTSYCTVAPVKLAKLVRIE